nr:polyphosphate kinase 1 [Geoalkalibacter halelectricus]
MTTNNSTTDAKIQAKAPQDQAAHASGVPARQQPEENSQPMPLAKRTPLRKMSDMAPGELFLNRELTWLQFNRRVLHEAMDERNPLLERVKFLAITSSNLDEFFMKRIGGLKQQLGAGMTELTVDGRTPRQQIAECYTLVRDMVRDMQDAFSTLKKELRAAGIAILAYDELSARERKWVRDHYYQNIFPLVTPQSIDPAHPFPFISNLSLNLLVTLKYPQDGEMSMARVKVPVGQAAPRFLRVGEKHRYVPLEEVMSHNLDMLFPEMEIVHCEVFRVTRNANTEKNEEHAEDLLAMIESELRERKFAPIVRMQFYRGMDPVHRGRLAAELGLDEAEDVFEIDGFMALRDLWEIYGLNFPDLKDSPHHPIDHPGLQASRKVFHMIRESGAILLQHPYESFTTSVERFLKEAARDPKVRAIKMTLYRTESESRIVDYLIDAAGNGKQVAVVVELKARFDEAANIRLASRMEEAGIHVTYGVVGLKTHAKVILVVRQDYNGLRRYMHFGTGNYHAGTSRIYSDLGLLTCDEQIGRDTTEMFNYLTTGYTPKRNYQKLLPAPKICKRALLERIEREVELHGAGEPGLIQFKMNALDDVDVVKALYRAGQAGVKIDLLVRDSCRLRPGIPGLSETVRVVSIVGRFLEHARLYYFRNGGVEEYFIGSADAMKRNLESRVETLVPVESPDLRRDLRAMLDIQLADRRNAWDMQPDGSYVQRRPETEEQAKGSHQQLIELAEKRQKDITRLRKRKSKHFGGRNLR